MIVHGYIAKFNVCNKLVLCVSVRVLLFCKTSTFEGDLEKHFSDCFNIVLVNHYLSLIT